MKIRADIAALKQEAITYRRDFHQHPEASLKEFRTAQVIRRYLETWGVPFEPIGETGTLGRIIGTASSGDPNRSILLRADIDALEITEQTSHDFISKHPGLMHACGHDSHTAALLTATHYLNDHRASFAGTIYVAFQQAEEIGAGAKQFVQSGLLDDIDRCFGIHVDPMIPLGSVKVIPGATCASCDIFSIEVTGRSAHVSQPHLGIDAVVIGANIVTKLQQIVSRVVDPLEPVVIGIGKFQAGTRYNIIANHAQLNGTLRALNREQRKNYLKLIEDIAISEGKQFGAEVSFDNYNAANVVVNDPAVTADLQTLIADIVGEEHVIKSAPPLMGADDFADFLAVIPGTYVRVGVASSEQTSYGLHHEQFDLDEDALPLMVQLHVDVALNYLQ